MKTGAKNQPFSGNCATALSVLLVTALFNKTILRVLADFESFGNVFAASDMRTTDWKAYFTSKYFLFPNLFSMLTVIWLLIWLLFYAFKRQP